MPLSADEEAEVMTLQEFKEACAIGAYTDDDGSGYLGDEGRPSKFSISCSGTVRLHAKPSLPSLDRAMAAGFTHVWWYGK
jgi:hypothetical protein